MFFSFINKLKILYFSLYGKALFHVINHSSEVECLIINEQSIDKSSQHLVTTWHSKIFLCLFLLNNKTFNKLNVLLSGNPVNHIFLPSLEKNGIEHLRGTISHEESIKNTRLMIKKIKQNENIFTPIDGPLGPVREVKKGFIYLSRKFNIPIIPLGVAIDSSTNLKTWDKANMFNKNTRKIVFYFGEAIHFHNQSVEECQEKLREAINQAEILAESYL